MISEFITSIGYTGQDCSIQLIDCTNNICDNNGSCIAEVTNDGEETGHHCECPPYFTGDRCEMSFDPCANKCKNNGTCKSSYIDGEYNTVCNCTEYFTGENCTVDIDDCSTSNPCLNNATCINNHGSFNCVCQDGFTGERCESNINNCVDVVCQNNGGCVDLINDFKCNCTSEYSGKLCQWHHSQTCNGVGCVTAHTVQCIDNYEGTVGTSEGNYGFECTCKDGYISERCEAKVLPCSEESVCGGSDRRLNCINHGNHNDYQCACKFGYAGNRCEIDVDLCENSPCKNGGTCEDHGSNFTCHCPPGYSGHNCSFKDDTYGRLLVSCPMCTVNFSNDHTT